MVGRKEMDGESSTALRRDEERERISGGLRSVEEESKLGRKSQQVTFRCTWSRFSNLKKSATHYLGDAAVISTNKQYYFPDDWQAPPASAFLHQTPLNGFIAQNKNVPVFTVPWFRSNFLR